MKSIGQIKEELNNIQNEYILEELKQYKTDERTGVKNLIILYEKKYNKYVQECERLEIINNYENSYYEKGFKYVAGVDEVGRGPLAGPILACSVILPQNTKIIGANDSKKLSKTKRDELYREIYEKALTVGIGTITEQFIDEFNISVANFKAMQVSVDELTVKPSIILVDGFKIPDNYMDIQQESIINGDGKSISIACASIVAKVTRDRIMDKYHEEYPMYGFKSNKGYGSQEHIQAIKKYGACPIHRRSFIKNIV